MVKEPTTAAQFRRLTLRGKKDWYNLMLLLEHTMTPPARRCVAAGAETWRSATTVRMVWADWVKISEALSIGERICAEASGGKVVGGRFNRLYGAWLKDHGLGGIDSSIRSWLRTIREHQVEIEIFRMGLPEDQRLRLNHPKNLLRAWKAAQAQREPM